MNSPITELLDLPNPFIADYGRVRVLEAADTSLENLRIALLDGTYRKPFLIDHALHRCLHFGLTHIQSTMRIDAPDALELPYTQKMMGFLLFNPLPERISLIGLGGGSLAKFCYRHIPQAQIEAIDIDPDVIALRTHFMIPDDDERFQVLCADGADYLARHPAATDVLLIDAFDARGLPSAIAKQEFLLAAMNSLSENGILIMNLAGERARYRPLIPVARDIFAERTRVIPVNDDGNYLLFAFKHADWEKALADLPARATALQTHYGLDFPSLARQLLKPGRAP